MAHLSVKFKGDFDSILNFFKQKSSEFDHKRISENEFLISSSESSVMEEFLFFKTIVIDESKDLEIIDVQTIGESDYLLAERYLEKSSSKKGKGDVGRSSFIQKPQDEPKTISSMTGMTGTSYDNSNSNNNWEKDNVKMMQISKVFDKAILPSKHVLPKDDPFWLLISSHYALRFLALSTVALIIMSLFEMGNEAD